MMSPFEIKNKVALISGGVSGIGYQCAIELLKNGLRSVTLADVNCDIGQQALEKIQKEFGPNKAIFVETDVSNKQSYEEAFRKTIEVFQNLDIVINNAGILNDATWEREIEVNIKGTIHGVLLGMEHYIPKYKTAEEGVIVNLSSIAGIKEHPNIPIYTGTKFAITGMSKAFGNEVHYKRTKVKVLALCPGATDTLLMTSMSGKNLGPPYEEIFQQELTGLQPQKAESVAVAMVKIIQNAKTGTLWVVENGESPYEFILPDRESFAAKYHEKRDVM